MKILPLSLLGILLIATACTKDFKTDDRKALAPFYVQLYKDVNAASAGSSFGSLSPGRPMYITDNHGEVNGAEYVEVLYGDSSAYVLKDNILVGGILAVVTSDEIQPHVVNLYSDKALSMTTYTTDGKWVLAAVVPDSSSATAFLIGYPNKTTQGFVASGQVFAEPADVQFYQTFQAAYDNTTQMAALTDARFSDSKLLAWFNARSELEGFNNTDNGDPGALDSEEVYAEGDAEYGDYYDENEEFTAEQDWMNGDQPLGEGEAPGIISKFFVFEDGSEMNAEGYRLENAQSFSPDNPGIIKRVKKVRFEVIPNKKINLHFDVAIRYDNSSFTKDFVDCEPGKPYFIEIEEQSGTLIFCSDLRVSITTGQESAVSTVSGSCGD